MGRMYTASTTAIVLAATTPIDLATLVAPATGMFCIHRIHVGQYSDAADAEAEMLDIQISRLSAAGTGGTTGTLAPHQVGHAATGVTCTYNRTTQGTVATLVHSEAFNVQAGWFYVPTPEERLWVPPSGIICVELATGPADALTANIAITYEELD